MGHRRLSMSQVVALSTPLLLIMLISLPTHRSTRIDHVVRIRRVTTTVVVVRPRTTTVTRTVLVNRPPVVRHDASPSRTTTSANDGSSSNGNGSNATPSELAASRTTAPLTGVLVAPFDDTEQSLRALSAWRLSANAPVQWTLACGSETVAANPSPIDVPDESDCSLDIVATTGADTTWTLEPVT